MCNEALRIEPNFLVYVSDHLKTQEMCKQAVRNGSWLPLVPDNFKTQEMCDEVMHAIPKAFCWIPKCIKAQDICKKAVEKDPSNLKYVPDHFQAGSS